MKKFTATQLLIFGIVAISLMIMGYVGFSIMKNTYSAEVIGTDGAGGGGGTAVTPANAPSSGVVTKTPTKANTATKTPTKKPAATCNTNGGQSSSTCKSLADSACGAGNWVGCAHAITDEDNTISCYSFSCGTPTTKPPTNTPTATPTRTYCSTNGGGSASACRERANSECGSNNWTGCAHAITDEDNTISCFSYQCNGTTGTCKTNGGSSASTCQSRANSACGEGKWTGCQNGVSDDMDTSLRCFSYQCTSACPNGYTNATACEQQKQGKCTTANGYSTGTGCASADANGCYSYTCVPKCTYSAVTDVGNGVFYVTASVPTGGSLYACCSAIGYSVSGNGCSSSIRIRNDQDEEYIAYYPPEPGICISPYLWNSTLRMCVDPRCNCDDGGCKDPEGNPVVPQPTGGYVPPSPATKTPTSGGSNTKTPTRTNGTSTKTPTSGGSNGGACYVVNGEYVWASSQPANGIIVRGVNSVSECHPVNPQTGTLGVVIAWIIGLAAIGYAAYYFKNIFTRSEQ